MADRDRYFMEMALAEALKAQKQGEVPIGAVLVSGEEIVGRGYNLRKTRQDPTAHAEIIALQSGAERLGSWRLQGCELYVTLEPCPMCAGALIQARVERLIYGALDPKGGAVKSLLELLAIPGFNHKVEVKGGVLAQETGRILQDFFQNLRRGRVSESG